MTNGIRSAETFGPVRPLPEGGVTRWTAVLADYWTLTKPEVNFLIVITTFAGFYLASPALPHPWSLLLFNTLFGTLLVAVGQEHSTSIWNGISMPRCGERRNGRSLRGG